MRIKLTLVFSLIISISFGQIDSTDYYEKVIGFIPNTKTTMTVFYDSADGISVDSLTAPIGGWIHFVVEFQQRSWVQVNNVSIAPGIKDMDHLNETWIEISNVWFNLSIDSSFCYQEPNEQSEYQVVNFKTVNLIEIKGNWAKAKFIVGSEFVEGWFRKEDQCGMPWTSCNY